MAGLKFRVLLDNKEQEQIFRDILIDDQDTFESLYKAIIKAFNFNGDQMASFYMSNDDWDKGHEISLMDMTYGDDAIDDLPTEMSKAILKDFLEEPDQKIILVYDFLKMWIFLIELIGYAKEGPATPEVIMSMGEAPLEGSKADDIMFGDDTPEEIYDEDEEDDFGFNDYEDGYSDDDISDYDSYDY
jgi:hypothetical protein